MYNLSEEKFVEWRDAAEELLMRHGNLLNISSLFHFIVPSTGLTFFKGPLTEYKREILYGTDGEKNLVVFFYACNIQAIYDLRATVSVSHPLKLHCYRERCQKHCFTMKVFHNFASD